MDFIEALTQAIAKKEGYGASPTNRPTRNANPGNLRERPPNDSRGPLFPQYPKDDGGYVIFPSPEIGWHELRIRVKAAVESGTTLASFINRWAPPSENDTRLYIQQVSSWLGGVDPNRPMSDYAGVEVAALPFQLPGLAAARNSEQQTRCSNI